MEKTLNQLRADLERDLADFDSALASAGMRSREDPLRREVEALLAREIRAGFIGCPECGKSWMWHGAGYECPREGM